MTSPVVLSVDFLEICMHNRPVTEFLPGIILAKRNESIPERAWCGQVRAARGRGPGVARGRGCRGGRGRGRGRGHAVDDAGDVGDLALGDGGPDADGVAHDAMADHAEHEAASDHEPTESSEGDDDKSDESDVDIEPAVPLELLPPDGDGPLEDLIVITSLYSQA